MRIPDFAPKDRAALRRKVVAMPKAVGRRAARTALRLYVILTEPGVPVWAKALVAAALGYLLFPFDAVFDFAPGIGLADDVAVLALTLAEVHVFSTPAVDQRVRDLEDRWLGPEEGA